MQDAVSKHEALRTLWPIVVLYLGMAGLVSVARIAVEGLTILESLGAVGGTR
jgi:hypothetical protein